VKYVPTVLSILVAPVVASCGVGSPASSANGSSEDQESVVAWKAGMETGDLSEWESPGRPEEGGGEFNSDGGDAIATNEIARTGGWSAKLTLPSGSGGTRLFRWRESRDHEEAYFSAWFLFPTLYRPNEWWNIFQFKSATASLNDPFWTLVVGNRPDGSMYLYLRDTQNERSFTQDIADLPVGAWVQISCFLRQSAMHLGQLRCWQDEKLLWDVSEISTRYPSGDQEWSVNNYSSGVTPSPVVIYVDDASVSLPPVFPSGSSAAAVSVIGDLVSDSTTVTDPG
jgi:hypothetical protein